ncbi:uncharacterized protein [Haliotis cracherodii]|uniref:uncharacterized protein n=1 Tax=Haliotis cracherodii TaxID=6455 RepID=UPI0039E77A3F
MRTVRRWLTERISVLVVTLLNKKQQRIGESACCLLAVDPSFTSIRDKINEAMDAAIESFLRQRQFCLILDFNSAVEQWCRNALHMRCEARGAKIVITNGDEIPDFSDTGGNVCCRYMCMPFRFLQGKAYKVQRRSKYDDSEVVFDDEQIMLCTANTKLQSYAEKALASVPTPSGRRVTKKKNTVTFTTSTQTAADSKDTKQNNGDCGVIDLEDTERGGEDENVTSYRDTTTHDRVFRDKDRACMTSSDPNRESSLEKTSEKSADFIPGSSKKTPSYRLNNKNNMTEKRTIPTPKPEEGKPEVQRETTDTFDESPSLDSSSGSRDPKMDIKAEVHCDNVLEHPVVEDGVKISYTKSKFSNVKDIETIIEPPDEEPVRSSIQTLKLGNFTSEQRNNLQLSIDVFDRNPNETVISEQPKNESNVSVAKQQKRIDKMLKDIMGPASNPIKKPPRKGKTKNGVINKGFQGENVDGKQPEGDHVRPLTSDGSPFARNDGYSTLPLTKVNGGRSTAKSAEFEKSDGGDFTTLVQSISAKRVTKIRRKFAEKEEEKLFTPRILLEKDRNCFSDLEPVEDFTDVEGHAASDREGVGSPRVISVKRTDKTVSMDSVRTHTDTELELTDCDTEDMSVSESDTKAHARKSKSNKRPDRGQRGQYDSRRKYLALNSLRRKTKAKALNAEIRNRIRLAQH